MYSFKKVHLNKFVIFFRGEEIMTKKDKAIAIASYSAMQERGITAKVIMQYATTAEIHGYHKGMFMHGGYRANPYRLIDKIRLRMERGTPMNKRAKPTASIRF